MKTKLSRFGRSSVSVILAVMMLLSTMLVGTVSNVEALTSTDTVYFVDNYGNWSSVNAYIWNDGGNLGAWPGSSMQDTGSVTSDGKKIFSYNNEKLSSMANIIFNSSGQTGDLTLNQGKLFRRTSEKNGEWKNIYQFSVASALPDGCTSATLKNGSLAYEGDTVTVTVKVSSGYSCTGLQGVADANVTKSDDNTYSITFKATKDLENITPIVGEVKNLNLKVAVVKYADVNSTDSNRLSNLNVTYTSSSGSQSTTTMTRDADDAKVYFNPSNAWGKVVEFYLYDLVLPEGTTKFKLNKGNEVTISDEVDYYAIYHYGSFKNESFTESDRYYTATVTADTSVATDATASFTANPAGEKFNDESSVVMYKYNTALTLSKSFDTEKYNFTKWSDGTTDFTEDSYTVKGDTALTAYFEKKESYKVTVDSTTGGSVTVDKEDVSPNQTVTITVNKNDGYKLDSLSVVKESDSSSVDYTKSSDTSYTFTMPSDNVKVTAKFAAVDYTVTYPEDTDAFTITDKSATTANVGDKITFKVSAKTGYEIKDVTADNATVTNEDGTYTFKMPAKDVAITVNASLVQYEIAKTGSDELTYKVGDNTVTKATMGQKVTVSATKTGYTLTSISVVDEKGETVEVDGLAFTMPASKVTVTPTFTANNHNIAYDATVTGLESVDVKTSADFGDTVSVTVTAKSGYTVTGITVKETNGDGTVAVTTVADKYQFTMPDYDVTITPVIVVAEIAEPEVKFFGGAGESTANISANQLYPITAEATPAANSKIQSAEAKITSDNASDATLTETETGYNFTSNVEGTFTIKYTVVAVSTLDSSKTSTVEKTITITTSFTETQKAYNTLKAYYETVKDPKQSDYSTDAYAALTAKLAEVKALIDAGLPASSATDTEKYTTAKTELEKAVADKLLNFYIKGKFRIIDSNGNVATINEHDAASVDEKFKFTSQGNNLYSLNTGRTLNELSGAIQGTVGDQYFFVYNKENNIRYETVGSPADAEGKDKALALEATTSTSGYSGTRFNSTDTSGTVTLWVDASESTYKFYYTLNVEPKYALAGGFGNPTWDKYDSQYLVKTPVEGKSTVFSEVLVNDTDSNKKFRLVDSSSVPYSVKGGVNLTTYTESNPCTLTKNVSGEGNDLYVPKGKYTLYVDQRGTTPKVWVERIIDTKNVTFSVTGEGTGTVSINGTNVGETSVQAVEIGSSYTITLTPNADSYVESFKVGDTEVTSNTYTGTMPNEDVAVTVVFAKKALHSVLVESDEGGAAEADITTAYSGQKVTVTVNADDDHVFDGISVKEKTSQDTVDCTKNEDGTYTFVMPDDDVNVYAKFREKNTYTVTVVSANQQLGTVSIADTNETTAQVKEGDTVTIKATPIDPNSFDTWTLTGKYAFKGCTSNDAEATVVVNSDVKATASFTETAPYQVVYGSSGNSINMNKTKYDGIYVSTATVGRNVNFTIYSKNDNQYAYVDATGYYYINDAHPSPTILEWITTYQDAQNTGLVKNAYGTAKYVVYNANTKTITLTDDPDYGTKATLYVKNGTYSTSFDTGNTKDYAKSSVAAGLTATKTSPCNTYSVAFDTNVNVQTTLTDTYRKAGYYVGAYCVNGRNYTASAKDADQGIYQANITITEDLAENGVVEVTPVYYNRIIEQNGDYITFYVDADQAVSDWGNTIAVDAYCYVNGVQSNADHLFGTYPGQPMVRDGRYYVINVPRYRYYIGTDGSLVKDTNSPVSGVTLNNYNNESIHGGLVPIKRNMQTYDFSDFVKLANLDGVKTIMFQNQFYNATDSTAKRNMSVVYGVETSAVPSNAKKTISNIVNANVNPWQDFTDYYGRDTDALGNILSDEQKENDCLYIISTGSFNSTAYSTKGEWVTIWNVYDHDGNLVTYGTPADFLDSTTSQYQALNKDAYLGKPVKISYEKGQLYSEANTSRTDGRWFYSKLGQEFTSDVAIEYKYQGEETYTADTDSNAGNNTGFVGTTTKATATINNVTTASFSSVTETAHLNVKVSNGWRFDGWFIKQGDKYTKVSDNYTDISTDVLMSNSYHIVACISEIPSGTLELNHTAYTGTDPASHSGTGFYYISAVLYDQTGAVKHSYTETQGKISIDDFAATDSLEITLRAVAHGDNTIYAVYQGIDAGYFVIGEEDTDFRGEPSFSYTFKVSAKSLFKDDKLAVNALNYYTDIVKVGGTCDITYKYKDRFGVEGEGNMVSYVVRNVELSTEEIVNKYQPSDDTITKYAPRIDTMYVDTKWVLTDAGKVEKGKSEATVIATQTNKTCKVYHPVLGDDGYYDTDIQDRTPYTVEFNSLLKDENGNFLLTTPEYNADKTLKFAYWEVYKVNKNGQSEGEVVTKCYERNFGLRIMADYYIVPVYSENVPDLTANINSPVLNREIYGDSANPTDKLYVDLLTAFTSTAIPTFKENTTDLRVECGVFVVRNNTSTLSVDDRNTLVNAAISNSTDTTSEILKGYIRDGAVEESLITKLGDLAKDSNVKDKTNTVANFGNDEYRITKLVFDNNSLTNKNRIDEVLKFTNNTANQNYIFTAYAFVVIKDSNGEVKDMCISESQYFNLCYVGNKALDNN